MKKKIVIALGGNAILGKGERGTYEEQQNNINQTINSISGILEDKNLEIVITHGNGPQVGNIILQNENSAGKIPAMPMFVCDAMSQGSMGFLIEQSVSNFFTGKNIKRNVTTIVSRILVSRTDPSFKKPSKPVGPYYAREKIIALSEKTGFTFKEDARGGWRRVVPSPLPLEISDIETIKKLIKEGSVVIAGGGGGIPVLRGKNGKLTGVDAVIDKDRASALLADNIGADLLIILTDTDCVYLNYSEKEKTPLRSITCTEAEKYMQQGHFKEGSMKPKIEAVLNFIKNNKTRKALITSPVHLARALKGNSGTWINAPLNIAQRTVKKRYSGNHRYSSAN